MRHDSTLLRGATLINPAGESGDIDLLIRDGQIVEMGQGLSARPGVNCRELKGKYLLPAFVDLHVHLREPGQTEKEDVATGTQAALKGGFCALAAMPNTQPVIDTPEWVEWLLRQGMDQGIDIMPVAAISKGLRGEELTDMEALVASGAVAFTDDGKALANSALMKAALKQSQRLGVPIFQHSEDPILSGKGQVDPSALNAMAREMATIPASAEDCIVARDIALQNEEGGALHVTHLSTAFAAEMVAWAKQRGQRVTADVTPHHLLLNALSLAEHGSLAKMKPPLRRESDRLKLIEMVRDGLIDCVATDHAPHTPEEKAKPFEETPFGIIGLETAFPLLFDRLVRSGMLTLNRLVELFTSAPARLVDRGERHGVIQLGRTADLVLFDPHRHFTVDNMYFRSKSLNSPFIGWQGLGVIVETMIAGQTRYRSAI